MSRLVQPALSPRKGLLDPRSTGAALPLRTPNNQSFRGTFKGR
jgi:hypothetical protein